MNMLKRFTPQFALLAIICIIAAYGYVKSEIIDANTTVNTTPSVIIDAGHGGFDGGAVAKDGTVEKDINLQISLKVSQMLKYNGYDVIMTRDGDTGTEDDENAAIASRKKSEISIAQPARSSMALAFILLPISAYSPQITARSPIRTSFNASSLEDAPMSI